MTLIRQSQLSLTQALAIPSFKILFAPLTFFLKERVISCTNKMLCWLTLPSTNAHCFNGMTLFSITDNIEHKTFVIILLDKFHRLIGLICFRLVGLSTFCIISIRVLVQLLGRFSPAKYSETSSNRPLFINSQVDLQKCPLKPLGPAALITKLEIII